MRWSSKMSRRLGIGLAVAVVALLFVRGWVIPALIVGRLQAVSGGAVTIRSWWLNFGSSGVVGLALHEGPEADSPVWATAERAETDLSLGGLLRGRFAPGRVIVTGPRLDIRLGPDGRWLNLPRPGTGGGDLDVPAVMVANGQVTFRPEGRPEMVVSKIDAGLMPGRRNLLLSGQAKDPTWGRWETRGTIDFDLGSGSIRLEGKRVTAGRETLERIAFVPSEVWAHFVPQGPMDVAVVLGWGRDKPRTNPVDARTEVTFLETEADFPSLGLAASATTGRLSVRDGVVTLDAVHGRSIGGDVSASGTLDFASRPPRIDLGLDLRRINVVDAPKSWQLDEVGITGLLTGRVQIRAFLRPEGIDLSGSSGTAVVEGGMFQGIPVKSLRLVMHAEKDDLQFATEQKADAACDFRDSPRRVRETHQSPAPAPVWCVSRILRDWAVAGLVALLPPPKADEPKPKAGGISLPRTITTRIELADVDLAQLVAKVQSFLGFPFPIPVQGRLGLEAEATIPLGRLNELKDYAFHGDLTLTGASMAKVDFGHLAARIDLADGVLELKDVRGRLVDDPSGGPDRPPRPSPLDVPKDGPLPPGAFRADLRAVLSPPGVFRARFEGEKLPLGELSAPWFLRPTPLSGLATMTVEGQADLSHATDPKAWDVSGRAESEQIAYRGTVLDRVALRFRLKEGVVNLPELAAMLKGQPLSARGSLDLNPPHAFDGTLDVSRWDLASVFTLIPGTPQPSPLSGTVDAHALAKGTLSPISVRTEGQGRLARFQAGPFPMGDVPFRWATEGESVAIRGVEAEPLDGRLAAEARVPLAPGKPIEGSARFRGIDTARLSAALPGRSLELTGKADGVATFAIPADASRVEADVQLSAADLMIQGLPAEHVRGDVRAQRGKIRYEVTADSLGGKVKFRGDVPLSSLITPTASPAPDGPGEAGNTNLHAVGFTFDRLWKAVGMSGPAARIDGLGALDANLRSEPEGPNAGLWLHGLAEFRNLRWGPNDPLGQLRCIVALTPDGWRIDPITGELLGGAAQGFVWGTNPAPGRAVRRIGYELRIDRAELKRAPGVFPELARSLDGFGNLRVTGTLGETLRSNAELAVPLAEVAGLPVRELRLPAELSVIPATGSGTLRVQHASGRLAGGQVHGDALFRLGVDRSFQGEIQLAAIDLETITRTQVDVARPATGRISGRISLNGPNPSELSKYRGKINLDLSDASLVNLPVFREIDRFLGAARGGLFEAGTLTAGVANRQIVVDRFALAGRLAQLHATGTVGFDTQLDLDVLINTNQIIPQTGQALARLIPGLSDAPGRRNNEAASQFANFLSNRLLKLRVTGTIRNPSINADPGVIVAESAVGFFAGVLKLPLGFLK